MYYTPKNAVAKNTRKKKKEKKKKNVYLVFNATQITPELSQTNEWLSKADAFEIQRLENRTVEIEQACIPLHLVVHNKFHSHQSHTSPFQRCLDWSICWVSSLEFSCRDRQWHDHHSYTLPSGIVGPHTEHPVNKQNTAVPWDEIFVVILSKFKMRSMDLNVQLDSMILHMCNVSITISTSADLTDVDIQWSLQFKTAHSASKIWS